MCGGGQEEKIKKTTTTLSRVHVQGRRGLQYEVKTKKLKSRYEF